MMSENKMSALDQFLSSINKIATKRSYARGITLFLEFTKKPIEEILADRKRDLIPLPNEDIVSQKQRSETFERQILEPYYQDLLAKGYKPNSAGKDTDGILRLFAYYAMPLKLRNGSPIAEGRSQIGVSRFPLRIEHIRKMYWEEKNLKYKLIVSMATDFPQRIEDFLSILVSELPDLNQEAPIEFMRMATKENQLQKSCLSALTVSLLKEYLEVYKPKTWLFEGDNGNQLSADSVNRELKRLAEACHIQTKPYNLSFHCFRDLVLSASKSAGLDPDITNLICGKAIPKAVLPYMKTVDIRKVFEKLQETLKINGSLITPQNSDMVNMLGLEVKALREENEKNREKIDAFKRLLIKGLVKSGSMTTAEILEELEKKQET